jgi:uncharacterized protein (DUF305 family)
MKQLIPYCILGCVALTSVAQAQRSQHTEMSGMHGGHNGMAMRRRPSMPMGMSGMQALQGLSGKKFDIAFMSQMIAHHRGAIDMAQQALKITRLAEVHKKAKMIVIGQTKEIATMSAWLRKWYGVKPSPEHMALMKADMKAMMSMKITTDRIFLESMIPHHQGAIDMSRLALKQGGKPELKQMAQDTIWAQGMEIARYKELLHHVH